MAAKPNIKQVMADIIAENSQGEFGEGRYPSCPRRMSQKELKMGSVPSKELVEVFKREWKKPLEDSTLVRFLKY